ncbi:MAG: helix-turn-helix domain-containing protein [Clostridia bacterium]|nr:helix-turn-helix domain-containing protein [Clostridia bacterium]
MASNYLGRKLNTLRKKSGVSQRDLAEELTKRGIKVTNQAVSKWESGSSLPNAVQFLIICDILGVYDISGIFLGKSSELLEGLNEEGKQRVMEYAGLVRDCGLFDDPKAPAPRGTRIRTLPVFDIEKARKSAGGLLESTDYQLVRVGNEVPVTANFGVTISGDSMEPDYHSGDVVWIQRRRKLEHGEVGVFEYEGKYYFKRLRDRVGGTRLQSIDANYPDIIVTAPENMTAIGIAVN